MPWCAPSTKMYMTLYEGCSTAARSLYISDMPTILGESPNVALYLQKVMLTWCMQAQVIAASFEQLEVPLHCHATFAGSAGVQISASTCLMTPNEGSLLRSASLSTLARC